MLPRHALLCLLLLVALFGSGSAAIRGKAVPLMIRELPVDLVEGSGFTSKEAVAYLSISNTNGATRFHVPHIGEMDHALAHARDTRGVQARKERS